MSTTVIDRPQSNPETDTQSQDRRATPRLPVRMPVSFEANNQPYIGVTRNVSSGGALIEFVGNMPPSDCDVEMQFYIPASEDVWHKDMRGYCASRTLRIAPPKENSDQSLKEGLVAVKFLGEMQFRF